MYSKCIFIFLFCYLLILWKFVFSIVKSLYFTISIEIFCFGLTIFRLIQAPRMKVRAKYDFVGNVSINIFFFLPNECLKYCSERLHPTIKHLKIKWLVFLHKIAIDYSIYYCSHSGIMWLNIFKVEIGKLCSDIKFLNT